MALEILFRGDKSALLVEIGTVGVYLMAACGARKT
jgi:hypothetical protein